MAHDIALYGLPAGDQNAIPICLTGTEDQRFVTDIAGLVARSHGMNLRACLDYLEAQYQNRINPRRVHAAFLAVLLRIADYFQIQATRAPTARTEVVSFRSQLSRREWRVHQSITDIHNTSSDPEAIVINATPTEVAHFLRLRNWLQDLQQELDKSWAALGEVYGLQTHNQLNNLGLRIRRVKSNLDDVASFAKTVSYVPAKVSFDTASTDLLKLLIAPLYGDDPGIRIRELVQNAVDAVREFDDLLAQRPELDSVERYSQSADIVLHVECSKDRLPVEIVLTDRGVGMTVEVIRNYFLKAGASFRQSDAWRRDHEDTAGHSRVLRSGRFGVGALAAFLLGDEIEVTTRHVFSSPDDGVTFSARLDEESISLRRAVSPVGTRIKIKVPDRLRKRLASIVPNFSEKTISYNHPAGHYFLRSPSIARIFSQGPNIEAASNLPQPEDNASRDWRCFSNSMFQKVFWTYSKGYPAIACNGIIISSHSMDLYRAAFDIPIGYIAAPAISVFDRDGYFPVDLRRKGLQTRRLPFTRDLVRSIADDLIAHALVEAPDGCNNEWLSGTYEGFSRPYFLTSFDWARWFVSNEGFLLNDEQLLLSLNPRVLVVAIGGPNGYQNWGDKLRISAPENVLLTSYLPGSLAGSNPRIKGIFSRAMKGDVLLQAGTRSAFSTYVPRSFVDKITALSPGRQVREQLASLYDCDAEGRWLCHSAGASPMPVLREAITSYIDNLDDPVIFCILSISKWNTPTVSDLIASRWLEVLGAPLIPFDLEKRRALEIKVEASLGRLPDLRREEIAKRDKERGKAQEHEILQIEPIL